MADHKIDRTIETLLDVVEKARKRRKHSGVEYIDWHEVSTLMSTHFKDEYNSKERWRSAYRRATSEVWREQHDKVNQRTTFKRKGATSLQTQMAVWFKNKRTLQDTIEMFKVTEDEVFAEATRMRLHGYDVQIWLEDGATCLQIFKKVQDNTKSFERLYSGTEFKIAVLSDTHMGHNKHDNEALHIFYKYAHAQGITDFYHAGDIVDGYYKNRDSSIYEQYAVGYDRQLEDVVQHYPYIEGVTTYFITGNHDVTHVRNGGANIGHGISARRDDLVYLGHNFAKIWLTEEVDLNLIHPGDGSAYSVSLRAQKIIDAAQGKRRSKIMAIGHYHKMDWIYWKGVHAFTMPSFIHQTEFMETMNLKSYVGAYILTIRVDEDGHLLTVMPEYVELG
jgi:predicted phosphodiesterase